MKKLMIILTAGILIFAGCRKVQTNTKKDAAKR
jgi:PBP1b-binding outer membrane lipoprotein LpoB